MRISDISIDIYADGADIQGMKEEYAKGIVKGFTTNPSLMKKAGISSYSAFSKAILKEIPDLPISMEVFADDFGMMGKEAREIASWGGNVYVKVPISNSWGESSIPLISELSKDGLKLNITAVFTLEQTKRALSALAIGSDNIVSVFAGRIADSGVDPEMIMREAATMCHKNGNARLLWASTREIFDIFRAARCGVDIVTVTNDILAKINVIGKDLEDFSLETVKQFVMDGKALGFSVL